LCVSVARGTPLVAGFPRAPPRAVSGGTVPAAVAAIPACSEEAPRSSLLAAVAVRVQVASVAALAAEPSPVPARQTVPPEAELAGHPAPVALAAWPRLAATVPMAPRCSVGPVPRERYPAVVVAEAGCTAGEAVPRQIPSPAVAVVAAVRPTPPAPARRTHKASATVTA
jgi:hypothetical protein